MWDDIVVGENGYLRKSFDMGIWVVQLRLWSRCRPM